MQFTPVEIQFTLLDQHERSLEAAKQTFDYLGSAGFVRECVKCDAASYRHSDGEIHIVIIEAMQAALAKKPQVAMALNLVPQLSERGFMIPERVAVDAYLGDPDKEVLKALTGDSHSEPYREPKPNRKRVYLGRIFELTAALRVCVTVLMRRPCSRESGFRQLESR